MALLAHFTFAEALSVAAVYLAGLVSGLLIAWRVFASRLRSTRN